MTAIEFNRQLLSYENLLKYFALKLTSNTEDAEDLLQETFLKALRYKDKFESHTNLKSWLYTIMKNTFINNYRRSVRKRNIMTNSDDYDYIKPSISASPVSPESEYRHQELSKSIDALSDDCKIPFKMHNDGYKYKEIAEELNLPIGTVKSRIFLARKKLSKQLQAYAH